MTTALVYHPEYLLHDPGPGHLETPQRLSEAIELLAGWGILDRMKHVDPSPATREDILRVHDEDLYIQVKNASKRGNVHLDADTVANHNTFETALLAAGGVMTAADVVARKEADNAMALVRPPGHHACIDRAMGFCYFNNVAVAVRHLQAAHGVGRVCIFDWDCHAGNGTMEIFREDPDVLVISLHQDPAGFYPGRGFADEIGRGAGRGAQINVPMAPGAGDADYALITRDFLVPVMRQFSPDFVFISAGFDSHLQDAISRLRLTEEGYAFLASQVKDVADATGEGRLALALEGGYDAAALALSLRRIAGVFLGADVSQTVDGEPLADTQKILADLRNRFSSYYDV